jgi:hypothetical protein
MHSELNEFLFRQKLAGKQVVVFIDEAQNISDTVLETVRLLSDFEATDKKLLQIVLAGQPELANRLSNPDLAQLRQRIAVQARLDALAPSEVVRFINHRLQVAGRSEPGLFTPGALELIGERSRGIPRLINNLCFRALTLGFALQSEQITADAVRRAAGDLSLEQYAATDAVLHQQRAPQATRGARQLWETCNRWFRGDVVRPRRFQASVGALVLGSLAIFLTLHGRSGTAQPTPETSPIIASGAKARELEPPPAWAVANKSDAMHGQELPKADSSQDLPASFTYVVQRNDTLRNLCMTTVGQYDNAVLAQIRKLNPDLRDPNHLLVGQEMRFPLYPPK